MNLITAIENRIEEETSIGADLINKYANSDFNDDDVEKLLKGNARIEVLNQVLTLIQTALEDAKAEIDECTAFSVEQMKDIAKDIMWDKFGKEKRA